MDNSIYWLGQAGFWIDLPGLRVMIDPYLSDSLAKKYAGKKFDHKRMAPPPVEVTNLPKPDYVLITHGHTDHMDPETLGPLYDRYPDIKFIVPIAKHDLAKERIGKTAIILTINAGQSMKLDDKTALTAFPACHEELDITPEGHYLYIGYGIASNDLKLFHPGDTIPFSELDKLIAEYAPDIALLPVNGRDETRSGNGIPGNMTLEEAIEFCQKANIPNLIPHHFGMFEFNTIAPELIDEISGKIKYPTIIRPTPGHGLERT